MNLLKESLSQLELQVHGKDRESIVRGYKKMKLAKVKFANGEEITTSINGSDSEIKSYYKVGKIFNIGDEADSMQEVISCEIIKS